MNRIIKFRGRLLNTGRIVYFDINEIAAGLSLVYSSLCIDPDSIEQFIATDKNGYDVYEGDKVIRIAGEDFIPEKTFPMSATFDDFFAINNGDIVLEVQI